VVAVVLEITELMAVQVATAAVAQAVIMVAQQLLEQRTVAVVVVVLAVVMLVMVVAVLLLFLIQGLKEVLAEQLLLQEATQFIHLPLQEHLQHELKRTIHLLAF
jgi:hypothetical protein